MQGRWVLEVVWRQTQTCMTQAMMKFLKHVFELPQPPAHVRRENVSDLTITASRVSINFCHVDRHRLLSTKNSSLNTLGFFFFPHQCINCVKYSPFKWLVCNWRLLCSILDRSCNHLTSIYILTTVIIFIQSFFSY